MLGVGLAHGAANAATIEVTNYRDDDRGCTLREAIFLINGGYTVVIMFCFCVCCCVTTFYQAKGVFVKKHAD